MDDEDDEDDDTDDYLIITLQGRRQLHVVARCSVAASYSPALLTLPATKLNWQAYLDHRC